MKVVSRSAQSYLRGRLDEIARPRDPGHEQSAGGQVRAADPARWESVHPYRGPRVNLGDLQTTPATAQSCCARRRKSAARRWALLRSFHACAMGLNRQATTCRQRRTSWSSHKLRASPLLADNPFLARMMSETDTAGLKRIGSRNLYRLRGHASRP